MKTFDKMAAQGDMMLVRIDALPDGVAPAVAQDGYFILTHSETGHNHVVLERPGVTLFEAPITDEASRWTKPGAYLVVTDADAVLEHQRSFDTHESIAIKPGVYAVRRQREYTPEGFRAAAD